MNNTPPDDIIENQFKKIFDKNFEAYEKCKAVLVQDLENILWGSGIGHVPVHARVKSWERASNSARRRYTERVKMADIWNKADRAAQDNYCEIWNFDRELAETLNTGDEVHNAMHDLLGARIALYFPDDVKIVETLLGEAGYSISKILPKGGMYDLSRLRKFFDERTVMVNNRTNLTQAETFQKSFSGYGALHFIVSLPNRLARQIALPESAWTELKMEIQVGTVVMHAWSEVEHDIIYKPSDGTPLSEDLKRIMDLINGIALTGEVALRQLEAITRQTQGGPAGEMQYAQSPAQLGIWIEQYFAVNNMPIEQPLAQDFGLKQLFEVLKTRRSHHRDSVSQLLESMKDVLSGLSSDDNVPVHMLLQCLESQPELTCPDGEEARFDAVQIVNFCDLAHYMKCTSIFGNASNRMTSKFNIVDLLDILHTKNSRYRVPIKSLENDFGVGTESGYVALAASAASMLATRGFFVRRSRPGRDGGHQNNLILGYSVLSVLTLDERRMLREIPDRLYDLFPPDQDVYLPHSTADAYIPSVFEERADHDGSGGRWQVSRAELNMSIEYMDNAEFKPLCPFVTHGCDHDDEYEKKIYEWMREGKIVPNWLWPPEYQCRGNELEDEYDRLITAVRFRSQLHPHLELEDEKAVWMGPQKDKRPLWQSLNFVALSTPDNIQHTWQNEDVGGTVFQHKSKSKLTIEKIL